MDTSKTSYDPFNPAAPEYRWKFWARVVTEQKIYVHIFWRKIVLALTTAGLLAWLLGAGAIWAFLKYQRDVPGISYVDLVLPSRWDNYRAALGRHYIELGRRDLAQREYRSALTHLIAGMQRAPDDIVGRRLLAVTYMRFGRVDLGLTTLNDGLALARDDLDYLKLAFALLLESQEDTQVITLARQLLPALPDTRLTHQFIALQAATAWFQRGRYDEVESLILTWGLTAAAEGQLLLARTDWERGYPDLALLRLAEQIPRFPGNDALSLELIHRLRELGRHDEARRQALLRQFKLPDAPGPRIDLLETLADSNDSSGMQREIARFLAEFADDPSALVLLAWFGVDHNDRKLVQRVAALAKAHRHPPNAFNLALIQAEIEALDFKAARAAAIMALRQDEENLPGFTTTVAALEAVALYGLQENERAELTLKSYLSQGRIRTADALYLARQLALLGVPDAARLVLARLTLSDPQNQAALTELIRLDLHAANWTALRTELPLFLKMRKPSRRVLEEILLQLNGQTDPALKAQIQEALARSPAQPASAT